MKKLVQSVLSFVLVLTLCAAATVVCAEGEDVKSEGVMTHAEYVAAELDTQVVVEAYVQAKQSWWDNKATVYAQDKDGHAAEFDKTGKVIYLSAADIDSILTLQCDVSN